MSLVSVSGLGRPISEDNRPEREETSGALTVMTAQKKSHASIIKPEKRNGNTGPQHLWLISHIACVFILKMCMQMLCKMITMME